MLRIAVISLLVANLLLLGFQGSKPAAQPENTAKQAVVEDSGVPTIHLFSEMMNDQDLMSGNRHCFSLGPFHSDKDKDETSALLKEVSANVSERETQALVEKGYWVFMPPYDSLLEANQALFLLQALGLKDIGVIYDGDWKNAISLGYFLRQKNALRRKKDLEDRDFAPMIRVQRQSETRYWLDYEQNPGSALIAIDMKDRPNDFMRRSLPCPDQNPFEITADVLDTLAAEAKQPQTQLPEEESQSPPEVIIAPQSEEINEPQPAEEDGLQPEDGDTKQSSEEIDPDPEESIDTPQLDNAEATVQGSVIETKPEASEVLVGDTLQKQVGIPEEDGGSHSVGDDGVDTELQGGNEAEPEAAENLEDDTLQQSVETPEEGEGSQPVEDVSADPEENVDSTPVDSETAVPEPAIETEPENSVGTGPVIGFGTAPEDSDEAEPEDSDKTETDGG